MSRFGYVQRSKEAPMDFEWTNRDKAKPAWSSSGLEDPSTPKKRSFEHVNPGTPVNGAGTPTFGRNQNVPFLFSPAPAPPQTPQGYPWMPPQQSEVHDVDMNEASPAKDILPAGAEETGMDVNAPEGEESRPVASGALRRVYNRRRRDTTRSRSRRASQDDESSGSEVDEGDRVALRPKSTSNHYTLNMPAPPPPASDTPYVLLGYLQFFFNLSLILIFLYLAIQFILTIQRDLEKRISEYTQDVVQDIAMCATRYKQSFCGTQYVAPDMLPRCADWETCMNRDPATIGRAKVSAELIAEIINGFVEPISWKTLIFTLTSLAFMTVFINTLLSLYRARYQPHTPAVPTSASYPLMTNAGYPSHPFGGFLPPGHTSDWSRFKNSEPEDLESPARRRRLEGGSSAKIK